MYQRGPWLGQVPLVPYPSMGQGAGKPPYFGQWGLKSGDKNGQVGPYDTQAEAFAAAVKAVKDAGAKRIPDDGFAKVVDSAGTVVGPST